MNMIADSTVASAILPNNPWQVVAAIGTGIIAALATIVPMRLRFRAEIEKMRVDAESKGIVEEQGRETRVLERFIKRMDIMDGEMRNMRANIRDLERENQSLRAFEQENQALRERLKLLEDRVNHLEEANDTLRRENDQLKR